MCVCVAESTVSDLLSDDGAPVCLRTVWMTVCVYVFCVLRTYSAPHRSASTHLTALTFSLTTRSRYPVVRQCLC